MQPKVWLHLLVLGMVPALVFAQTQTDQSVGNKANTPLGSVSYDKSATGDYTIRGDARTSPAITVGGSQPTPETPKGEMKAIPGVVMQLGDKPAAKTPEPPAPHYDGTPPSITAPFSTANPPARPPAAPTGVTATVLGPVRSTLTSPTERGTGPEPGGRSVGPSDIGASSHDGVAGRAIEHEKGPMEHMSAGSY